MDDYKAHILGTEPRTRRKAEAVTAAPPPARQTVPLKKRVAALEEKMGKFQALIGRIDEALSDQEAFLREPTKAARLAEQRVALEKALAEAEDEWLMLAAEQDAAQ